MPVVDPNWVPIKRWGARSEHLDVSFLTDKYIREHFSSAGVLPISEDGQEILLGAHKVENYLLWGPFAGKREPGEGPEATAEREFLEELGVYGELHPPTVLVNMVSDKTKIGVIYPTILKKCNFPIFQTPSIIFSNSR